ncbi:[protein-PII] uridylyltransferase [Bermanella marisrubri]|uniref:Bifunctional uridylyltransferase/uridylyl-removing enzyme n=1 Tax=Bermanella marisrubri TaxID=207949 RepID=Q1N1X6_9GAMM|nr:[protein-PII] uridylyltransferase [Bermanella marisrubri]EAT12155.1 PII uridylyl-transferase [Oceanobacter sp. RED65] [Bermanella marisrubri]QIZ83631.1 [protein-PII] uridylyltransferase [Bermanella marisrubri]
MVSELDLQIFDYDAFVRELDSGKPPIPLFKEAIKHAQSIMHEHFRATLDANTLVQARALFMDQLLQAAWTLYFPHDANNIALLAVGGYGRGELHPHSDIDILLLSEDESAFSEHSDAMQGFITFMWDIKLDVGHGVRTIADCQNEAEKDLTIVTNLMETRTLAGPDSLRTTMTALTGPKHIWPVGEFFLAKWQEQMERHDKHHDTDNNLEPNLKKSQGGLRDIHTVVWVLQRHFGNKELENLFSHGILTDFEYSMLLRCREFLWQLRYALHMVTGREEDQLLFDYQKEIADILGFEDQDDKLAVEAMMHQYYRYALALSELNDLLMLLFKELLIDSQLPEEIEVVNQHFQKRNGYLEIRDAKLFEDYPNAILEVFYHMAADTNLKGVRANTIRSIRDHRHDIDEAFRSDPDNIRTFMAIIRCKHNVGRELDRMLRYGVLGAYIPEFGAIIGHMEYDLFHSYTIDQHSLRAILFMRQLRHGKAKELFPLASKVIHSIPKKEILYLAALLHDVGKALPGDHEVTGAEIAEQFCIKHGLSQKDTDLVVWLVANHLVFSQNSQRIDFADPDALHHFATQMLDRRHLEHLFVFSTADIYSTNKKLWTGWRAEQMRHLFRETQRVLRRGLDTPIDKDAWVQETQQEVIERLAEYGYNEQDVHTMWNDPGDEYFLRENVDTLVWHALALFKHGDSDKPLVLIGETSDLAFEGATQIFIYMKDQPHLFAAMTAALDQLHLNIQDARIITSANNNALDTYVVLDENGDSITDPLRLEKIQSTLEEALSNPESFPNLIQRRTSRQLKQFEFEPTAFISNDPYSKRTLLEVIAPDRPGLLARMGKLFMDYNLSLETAKIMTEVERIDDIFYITDANGDPISDPEFCMELQQAVVNALSDQLELQASL